MATTEAEPEDEQTDGQIRTAPNPERGCGYLKEGKVYLRARIGPNGILPAFVEFESPVPWLEGQLRSYAKFPGVQFEVAVTPSPQDYAAVFTDIAEELLSEAEDVNDVDAMPPEKRHPRVASTATALKSRALSADAVGVGDEILDKLSERGAGIDDEPPTDPPLWHTQTDPPLEVHRHIARLGDDMLFGHPGVDGTHVGQLAVAGSHDLLMWVGETYYDTPEEFVAEAKAHGVSKAIPIGSGSPPPTVNPGRTRLFLIHPRAIESGTNSDGSAAYIPGIIGYSYLTDVVYTGTEVDGEVEFPEWARKQAAAGEIELVRVGERVPASEAANTSLVDFDDGEGDTTDDSKESDSGEARAPSDLSDRVGWGEPIPRERLETHSYNELRAAASDAGLDVGSNPTKDDLVDALAEVVAE